MKRLIFIIIGISLILVYLFLNKKPIDTVTEKITIPSVSPTPTPYQIKYSILNFKEKKYGYAIIKTIDVNKIELIPNFDKRLSSVEVKKRNGCKEITNANFYDKNNQPLGLFITNYQVIGKRLTNIFFNGFISLSDKEAIISAKPLENYKIVLQSGPILIQNGEPFVLSIVDDKEARRIAAFTENQKIYFIVIFDPDSNLSGPKLADLPEIIIAITNKEKIMVKEAINLDGGSASVFINKEISLLEFSTVGGFFCIL